MKKSALALLAALSFVSCNRDNDSNPSLVGVWKREKEAILSGKDNSLIGKELFPKKGCEDKSSLQFKKDGKYIYTTFYSDNGNCAQDGSQGNYTYDAKTKKLTITIDGDTKTYQRELTFINQNKFILSTEDEDHNEDGVKDKFVIYYYR